MTPYRVVFSPEAEEQLANLYHYIAHAASPDIAANYAEAIGAYCESLQTFPHRGTKRDDVRPVCASPTTGSARLSPSMSPPNRFPSSASSTADRITRASCTTNPRTLERGVLTSLRRPPPAIPEARADQRSSSGSNATFRPCASIASTRRRLSRSTRSVSKTRIAPMREGHAVARARAQSTLTAWAGLAGPTPTALSLLTSR